jgi:MraZ protein
MAAVRIPGLRQGRDKMESMQRPFLGFFECTLDGKGRVLFGKQMRDRLGSEFAMLAGSLRCVDVVRSDTLDQMRRQLESSDCPTEEAHLARLRLNTVVTDLNFDNQGRVTVPAALRSLARLTSDVLVIGCLDHVELWSMEEYQHYKSDRDGYTRRYGESLRDS